MAVIDDSKCLRLLESFSRVSDVEKKLVTSRRNKAQSLPSMAGKGGKRHLRSTNQVNKSALCKDQTPVGESWMLSTPNEVAGMAVKCAKRQLRSTNKVNISSQNEDQTPVVESLMLSAPNEEAGMVSKGVKLCLQSTNQVNMSAPNKDQAVVGERSILSTSNEGAGMAHAHSKRYRRSAYQVNMSPQNEDQTVVVESLMQPTPSEEDAREGAKQHCKSTYQVNTSAPNKDQTLVESLMLSTPNVEAGLACEGAKQHRRSTYQVNMSAPNEDQTLAAERLMLSTPNEEDVLSNEKKRKGRQKTKCLKLDEKTKSGPLMIDIPKDIARAVGENVRDIVNYIGYVVRSNAPLDVNGWKEVHNLVGKEMIKQVKEKFQVPKHVDDEVYVNFLESTMRRLYRGWRGRLSKHYQKLKTDEEHRANIPADVSPDDWEKLVAYFKSEDFQKKSLRNKASRAKVQTKHTCGSRSYLEVEELMRDPATGAKKSIDEVWFAQHTRKEKDGTIQWADSKSKEIYEKLKELVIRQSEDGALKMTDDEILQEVLGARSAFIHGKGVGKKASNMTGAPNSFSNILEQEVHEMQKEIGAIKTDVNELRDQIQATKEELRAEIRAEMQEEMRAMFKERFALILSSMSGGLQ